MLDRALLIAAARRAHLHADTQLHHHFGERRVEALDLATHAALLHDRARTIERRQQRLAAKRDEVIDQRPHERLDALVLHQRHGDEARVLEPRREEVNALLAAVDVAHVHVAEVVLRELARKPFEPNHRRRARRAGRSYQRVEGALGAVVASSDRSTEQLPRRRIRLPFEPSLNVAREPRGLRRPTDPASTSLRRIVRVTDRLLAANPLHRVDRHTHALRDRCRRHAHREQDLNLVALEEREHFERFPPPHPTPLTVAIATIITPITTNITRAPSFEEPQNFGNGTPQNLWNHHLERTTVAVPGSRPTAGPVFARCPRGCGRRARVLWVDPTDPELFLAYRSCAGVEYASARTSSEPKRARLAYERLRRHLGLAKPGSTHEPKLHQKGAAYARLRNRLQHARARVKAAGPAIIGLKPKRTAEAGDR